MIGESRVPLASMKTLVLYLMFYLFSPTFAQEDDFLLFTSTSSGIHKMPLSGPNAGTPIQFPIPSEMTSFAIGVAFDPVENGFFWCTYDSPSTIGHYSIDQQETLQLKYFSSQSSFVDIVFDPISRVLFVADQYLNKISMLNVHLNMTKDIITSDINAPYGIALDTANGKMYWSDLRLNRIEVSNMDGTERKIIIDTDIELPWGIVLDIQESRLYWVENWNHRIQACDLDGTNRQNIPTPSTSTNHVITLYGDYIMMAGIISSSHRIYQLKKDGTDFSTYWNPANSNIYGLRYVSITNQEIEIEAEANACKLNNGGCEQFCIPLPNVERVCKCGEGYGTGEDGTSCVTATFNQYVYFVDSSLRNLYQMDIPTFLHKQIPITGHATLSGVAIDPVKKKLYWSDIGNGRIGEGNFEGINSKTIYQKTGSKIQHLAFDEKSGLLYVPETASPPNIATLNPETGVYTILINTNIGEPHGMAVDSENKYFYWSDVQNHKIEKVSMENPSDRVEIFSDHTGTKSPTVILLEVNENKMYWTYAGTNLIEEATLNGGSRRTIAAQSSGQTVGMAILGDFLYLTDATSSSVRRFDRTQDPIVIENVGDPDFVSLGPIVTVPLSWRNDIFIKGYTNDSNVYTEDGATETLECKAVYALDNVDITWYLDNQVIPSVIETLQFNDPTLFYNITATLTLPIDSSLHGKELTCEAISSDSETIIIAKIYLSDACEKISSDNPYGYTLWGSEERRSVLIPVPSGSLPICDKFILPGWYRVQSNAGEEMPTECVTTVDGCSTTYPIWLQGDHPTVADGKVKRTACKSDPSTPGACCIETYDVKVKNCGTFYVYNLEPPSECSVAYCFGNQTECTNGQTSENGYTPCKAPAVNCLTTNPTVSIGTSPDGRTLELYCNYEDITSLACDVKVDWYFNYINVWEAIEITGSKSVLHQSDFASQYRLLGSDVTCSIRAYDPVQDSYGEEVFTSQPYFAGVKILTGTSMTIYEGDTDFIQLQSTIPFLCDHTDQTICKTYDIKASFKLQVLNPNDKQLVCPYTLQNYDQVKVREIPLSYRKCGFDITVEDKDDIINGNGEISNIPVSATVDNTNDGNKELLIKLRSSDVMLNNIFGDYALPDIQVSVLDKDSNIKGVYCYSNNDPHMRTFDGRSYENQREGEFIFYEHVDLPIRVHTYYLSCNSRATCNCGVAVQAGNSVIVIDKCRGIKRPQVIGPKRFRMTTYGCDALGKGLRLVEVGGGYEIHLPIGSMVKVSSSYGSWFNVMMAPSSQDFDKSQGLCGSFNKNSNDDFKLRNGLIGDENSFALSWRIPNGSPESLYSGKPIILTGDPKSLFGFKYCECGSDTETIVCDESNYELCTGGRDITNDHLGVCNKRKKREAEQLHDFEDEEDFSFSYNETDDEIAEPSWPSGGMTEAEARAHCENVIGNNPGSQACIETIDLGPDMESHVEECMKDILFSGTTEWGEITKKSFRQVCEKEVLKDAQSWDNSSDPEIIKPKALVFDNICEDDCNNNGICENGVCKCYSGYSGLTCEYKNNEPPSVYGLLRDGLCDREVRPCETAVVYGENFRFSESLTCHMTPVYVTPDGIQNAGSTIPNRASYQHSEEVHCEIPEWTSPSGDDFAVQGHLVTVSNDGKNAGEEFLFVKFTASCVSCNTETRNCTEKTDICHIDGSCYDDLQVSELDPCMQCNLSQANQTWTPITVGLECENMCQNGGTIIPEAPHRCLCAEGFTGPDCETNIDDCPSNACNNNGICHDGISNFTCECNDGFTGEDCETNINECSSTPCQNDGTCKDADNSYTCECIDGFRGKDCETDIDDCSPDPCGNGATCKDGVNLYTCECSEGFTGTDCETNIDDCSSTPCQNSATCRDGVNSHTCECRDGFTGVHCETDIDECLPNPCENAGICNDAINSYTCKCADGFTGTRCQHEIDECHPNPCGNGGTCIDKEASFVCNCPTGFSGETCETNIDECASNPCQNDGSCIDGIDSYECKCSQGFEGHHCEFNINDCSPNPCLNGGKCEDGINEFQCQCPERYSGSRCEINLETPCEPNPCQNEGVCSVTDSYFSCTCPNGYSGSTCSDKIDFCFSEPCGNGGTCTLKEDGYECECSIGYTGENCEGQLDSLQSLQGVLRFEMNWRESFGDKTSNNYKIMETFVKDLIYEITSDIDIRNVSILRFREGSVLAYYSIDVMGSDLTIELIKIRFEEEMSEGLPIPDKSLFEDSSTIIWLAIGIPCLVFLLFFVLFLVYLCTRSPQNPKMRKQHYSRRQVNVSPESGSVSYVGRAYRNNGAYINHGATFGSNRHYPINNYHYWN